MSKVTGVVERMTSRAAGRGHVWSIKVNDSWYGGMWDEPACKEGDTVEFTVTRNGQYENVAKNSLSVIPSLPSTGGATGDGPAAVTNPTQTKIAWQAARNSAIALVAAALGAEAIQLPAKKGDKYDALLDIVDDLTVRYFQDTSDVDATINTITGGAPAADVYEPTIEE